MSDQEIEKIKATVSSYVSACRKADTALLESVFAPNALMVGYMQGELLFGSIQPFVDAVAANPSPDAAGTSYQTTISDIRCAGDVGQATLIETGYMSLNFTNYFQLLKLDGKWQITTKSFHHS